MTTCGCGIEQHRGVEGSPFREAAVMRGPVGPARTPRVLVGALPGEGIGPEVVACGLRVLEAVAAGSDVEPIVEKGGAIGLASRDANGRDLSPSVIDFCTDIFARGGAVFAGAAGGRFVYDLRSHFDLYAKFSPVKPAPELADAARLKPDSLRNVDFVIVRDNIAGVYQGESRVTPAGDRPQAVRHAFSYTAEQVRRLIAAGAKLAAGRTRRMAVVAKRGGMPVMTELWSGIAEDVAGARGLELSILDADYCAYQVIQHPDRFDVVVTPNLVGDIVTDLSAVLLASRGLSFSGNFSPSGHAVYQTNHGAAYDLAGTGRANPGAQILALAMMLRESFGLHGEAKRIEDALRRVWRQGWRTADIATEAGRAIGAEEFTSRVVEAVAGERAP
jgi:3-isopropylmalate dehydrogenase